MSSCEYYVRQSMSLTVIPVKTRFSEYSQFERTCALFEKFKELQETEEILNMDQKRLASHVFCCTPNDIFKNSWI